MRLRNAVPNALTVLRLLLAFAFPFLPRALWLPTFGLAALTEFLDGHLARRWDCASRFGQILDPVADKVFILLVAVTLVVHDILTPLEVLLASIRDACVVLYLVFFLARGLQDRVDEIEPRWPGKLTTGLQYALLVWCVAAADAPVWLVGVTAVAGTVAAADYLRTYHALLWGPRD